MTTLGSPGLSSQSVSGFSGREMPKNAETDWDDNLGKPKGTKTSQHKGTLMSIALHMQLDEMPQRAGTCFAILVLSGARHKGTMAQRHKDLTASLAECMVGPRKVPI